MRLMSVLVLAVVVSMAAEIRLGKPLALKEATAIEKIVAQPGQYLGKSVQVKGKVTEVCQMMGCWMELVSSSGSSIRIKVNDGEITFPKDSGGRTAIAEGKLVKLELTREQAVARARHEAEESGRKFDPASVKGGAVIYQIQGTGAVLVD